MKCPSCNKDVLHVEVRYKETFHWNKTIDIDAEQDAELMLDTEGKLDTRIEVVHTDLHRGINCGSDITSLFKIQKRIGGRQGDEK